MRALYIKLKGDFAFFKNPESNTITYKTYKNIPVPAVLGLLGAITGKKGYSNFLEIPEFYLEYKDLEIGFITKFDAKGKHTFVNSTGLANKDGTLIVSEEYLSDVSIELYIKYESSYKEKYETLKDFIGKGRSAYQTYFGKTEYFCYIDDFAEINLEEKNTFCNSVFPLKNLSAGKGSVEYLPVALDENLMYVYEACVSGEQLIVDRNILYDQSRKNGIFFMRCKNV